MRNRFSVDKKCLLFGGITVLQLLFLLYLNIRTIQFQVDFDSSSGMCQLVEIWRQKTFLIKDWGYQTTVGWDIPLFFAVFIYGAVRDVFLSMGIANCLFIALFVWCVFTILKLTGVRTGNCLIALSFMLVPYTVDALGYLPMLFTGTESYMMKLLITLLLVQIFLRIGEKKNRKATLFSFLCFLLFSFLSAVSSGIYMLVCGIAPLLAYLIFETLSRCDWKRLLSAQGIAIAGGILAFGCGILAAGRWGFTNTSSSMKLLTSDKVADNALRCLVGIGELLGAFTSHKTIRVLSPEGIASLFCVLVFAFVVFTVIYYFVRVVKKKEQRPLVKIVLWIQFANLCILFLTDTTYGTQTFEYRYHIVSVVPAMLLTGVFFNDMKDVLNRYFRRMFVLVSAAALVVVSVLNGKSFLSILNFNESKLKKLSHITEIAKERDARLIVGMSDDQGGIGDMRLLRVCDFDVNVMVVRDSQAGVVWGASDRCFENGNHRGKTLLAVKENKTGQIPLYVLNKMKKIEKVDQYEIYYAENNPFDLYTKLPEKGQTCVDFPYSPGYNIDGEINGEGELEANEAGGVVMMSAQMEAREGDYRITVHYRTEGSADAEREEVGLLKVYYGKSEVLCETSIRDGSTEAVIPSVHLDQGSKPIHVEIHALPNSGIRVQSVEIQG